MVRQGLCRVFGTRERELELFGRGRALGDAEDGRRDIEG